MDAVQTALDKYLAEFADIPESARNIRAEDGGKTPSEHLSYQLGWVSSLLDWERREQAGEEVHTPAEGFKWNNLGGLYQRFYQVYSVYTLAEQQVMLRGKTAELCVWIEGLSEDELFLIVCMDRGFERRRAVPYRTKKMGGNCCTMAVVEMDTYQHRRAVYQFPHQDSEVEKGGDVYAN